jgi:hypothetical protein
MFVRGLLEGTFIVAAFGWFIDDLAAPSTLNSPALTQIASGKLGSLGIEYLGGSAETPVQIRQKIGFFRHTVKLPIETQKNLYHLAN